MELLLTKGQGCHLDLYRDEAVYFCNWSAASLPEGEAVIKCLWFMVHSLSVSTINFNAVHRIQCFNETATTLFKTTARNL